MEAPVCASVCVLPLCCAAPHGQLGGARVNGMTSQHLLKPVTRPLEMQLCKPPIAPSPVDPHCHSKDTPTRICTHCGAATGHLVLEYSRCRPFCCSCQVPGVVLLHMEVILAEGCNVDCLHIHSSSGENRVCQYLQYKGTICECSTQRSLYLPHAVAILPAHLVHF
jgi:hypothetical protein